MRWWGPPATQTRQIHAGPAIPGRPPQRVHHRPGCSSKLDISRALPTVRAANVTAGSRFPAVETRAGSLAASAQSSRACQGCDGASRTHLAGGTWRALAAPRTETHSSAFSISFPIAGREDDGPARKLGRCIQGSAARADQPPGRGDGLKSAAFYVERRPHYSPSSSRASGREIPASVSDRSARAAPDRSPARSGAVLIATVGSTARRSSVSTTAAIGAMVPLT